MDPNPDYDASDEIRHQLVSPGSCAASTPRLPIPLSKGHPAPMQRVTASMSAPTRAHRATNELMYEIFRARRALPAHVANSAPKPSCSFVDDREAIS